MQFEVKNADKIVLRSASDVYRLMRMILEEEKRIDCTTREYFWVIALNTCHNIVNIELIGMGNVHSVSIMPADIFTLPLHKRAEYIILVHNHPTGDITPSEDDKDLTARILHVGKNFRIQLQDHIILGDNSFFSFNESMLLTECELDEKYALTFVKRKELEDQIEQRREKIRREAIQEERDRILIALDALSGKKISKKLLDDFKHTLA